MSTNKTTNLQMHSWVGTDYVKRIEFNENFDKLDVEVTKKASDTQDGRMSKEDFTRLKNVAADAEVNQNAFSNIAVSGQVTVAADGKTDTLTFVSGTNIAITTDATTDTVTIGVSGKVASATTADKLATTRAIALGGDVTGTTNFDGSGNITITATVVDDSHNHVTANIDGLDTALAGKASTAAVTTSVNGLMIAADKSKLDGVAVSANNYVHPANHPASIITQDASNRFTTDAEKATWNAKASTAVATTTADGLMDNTDKVKLDGIEAGAQANDVITVNGRTGAVVITASELGAASDTAFTDYKLSSQGTIDSLRKQNTAQDREIAFLKLKQAAADRVKNGTTFADDMLGNSFGMTLNTKKAKSTVALTAGTTILDDKVDNASGFVLGQKVTVLDDVIKEIATITRSEVVNAVATVTRTDVSVVASAYNTTGNGGRKLVRLSNGWLISAVWDSTNSQVKLLISKDNFATIPTQLCYRNAANVTGFSLANKGNQVYLIVTQAAQTDFFSIDATTQSNVALLNTVIDSGQTAAGQNSLAINEAGTELHAAWASKNATYPSSFNIRYAKGTISQVDGSVMWGAVEQLTAETASTENFSTPSIVLDKNSIPHIATIMGSSGGYSYLFDVTKAFTTKDVGSIASAWGAKFIYNGSTYTQGNPSAIFVPTAVNGLANGRIWVTWHGLDATDTTYENIRVSYSDDGGVTWSAMQKLTSGNTIPMVYPSITVNKNNKVFVLFHNNTSGGIRQISYAGTWSTITDITGSTNVPISASSLLDLTLDFTQPLFIYKNSAKVGFYGTWQDTVATQKLECSPLVNSYKKGAWIARSTMNADGTFPAWDGNFAEVTRTDVSVVASAYDTSGNGGRKLVLLSNGWLVSAVLSGTNMKFYVSKDNGTTFTFIKDGNIGTNSFSLVSKGTKVYVIANNTASEFYFTILDAITETFTTPIKLGITETAVGNVSLAINAAGTELHATWASKNATYPNNFNIRYAKGTIAGDGSVTWGAVTQITQVNAAGQDFKNPCIVVNASNLPVIFADRQDSYYLYCLQYDGATWNFRTVINGASYVQSNPSAIFVPQSVNALANGRIWVAWQGLDSTDTTKTNIRVSYSDDGGVTWSAIVKVTSGNAEEQMTPSITANKNNDIFLLWYGGNPSDADAAYNIRTSKNSGSSWGSVSEVMENTTNNAAYPSALLDFTFNFSSPLFIYTNYQTTKVGFYGTWQAGTAVPLLAGTALYTLPSTDYVGAFVQKAGAVSNIDAYINDVLMTEELDIDEYMFTKTLAAAAPIELRLEMSRVDTVGGTSDKITRILGGVA